MTNQFDLTGQIFSKLTIIKRIPNAGKHVKWLCKCECGNSSAPTTENLTSGNTTSCGCTARENAKNRLLKHGLTGTPEYKVWLGMRKRCYQKASPSYARYGARGIIMSNEWLNSAKVFVDDMGEKPSPYHSIERINNSKGYSAENCRWATRTEQALNRRSNHIITHNGDTKTICEWADSLGIKRTTLLMRINSYGWPIHKALTHPVRKR